MRSSMSEIEQLERILRNPPLVTSPSLSRFLRYIVEETLAGRSGDIRESTLGVEVFDRGEDFDPRLDPIVRVEASRLRSRLQKYYDADGTSDRVRISLPRGAYVPCFESPATTPVPPETERSLQPAPP